MTITNTLSPNRGYPVPVGTNNVAEDVLRLASAIGLIDVDVANILISLADKAALGHTHTIADISSLASTLAAKSDAGHNHNLADLADVNIAGAPVGRALITQASGIIGFSEALVTAAYVDAAIAGILNAPPATLDTLNELAAALGDDPNYAATTAALIAEKAAKTIQVLAGTGLTGGGDLSANRTLALKSLADAVWTAGTSTELAGLKPAQLKLAIEALGGSGPDYKSSPMAITIGSTHTFTHGLGAMPSHVETVLVCQTAEEGFSVGDEVPYTNQHIYSSAAHRGVTTYKNATYVKVNLGTDTSQLWVIDCDTWHVAALTTANWKIMVRAWL